MQPVRTFSIPKTSPHQWPWKLNCKHPCPKPLNNHMWLIKNMCVYLALVALHLLLKERLPGHLLKFFSQVLTRLHVGLGNVLGQMFWNTMQHTFKTPLSRLTALNVQTYWAVLHTHTYTCGMGWHLFPISIIKCFFLLADSFMLTELLRERIFQKMQCFICFSNQRTTL